MDPHPDHRDDRTWAAIQARHPDVPGVVIALGAGSGGKRGLKLGHFAADRWQRGDGKLPELFVGGEGLSRGSRGVLGTLLHEAAHGVASTRDIQDTSRGQTPGCGAALPGWPQPPRRPERERTAASDRSNRKRRPCAAPRLTSASCG